jgi:hypothetical protein
MWKFKRCYFISCAVHGAKHIAVTPYIFSTLSKHSIGHMLYFDFWLFSQIGNLSKSQNDSGVRTIAFVLANQMSQRYFARVPHCAPSTARKTGSEYENTGWLYQNFIMLLLPGRGHSEMFKINHEQVAQSSFLSQWWRDPHNDSR